jgi:pimeloyl-ACP methyl ester carboxylesterase
MTGNAPSNGRYAQVGDVSVYYEETGTGEPLVLVHGLSGSGRWWAKNVSALAERYRVYVVDLAGFGRSRAARRVALENSGVFLGRWMSSVGIERASIVGHSMGGLIAASLAADDPERVDRLALVNAAALPISRANVVLRFGLARELISLPPAFLPVMLTDGLRAGPVSVMGAARDLLHTDIRSKLNEVTSPTLIVWGARDQLLPLELGVQLSAAVPDARLHAIPNAGHNPMWDQPADFNRVILDFLSEPAAVPAAA